MADSPDPSGPSAGGSGVSRTTPPSVGSVASEATTVQLSQLKARPTRPAENQALPLSRLGEDDYSGHSFRIGAATLSFSLTPRHELITDLGDWASDAYLGYNRATPPD